ncbi:MAG: hypothetical protein QOF78_1991 [Phycisphaerales bacterium]|nr:hypothetical protein [Phycisphaerales bacterium]
MPRLKSMKAASLLLLVLFLSPATLFAQDDAPPAPPREFRGVWIATVGNINWPSKPGLPVQEQQREIIDLLDYAARLKLNAVFIQVRPAADAFYPSNLEPWSQYLTGTQGQPPTPFYDPLEFWITEAHRRGIELHAWYNLYRARAGKPAHVAPNHISRRHPELMREYGTFVWMDPGEPASAQHTLAVILDIVRRYDVDGVHTDDYYYPYVIKDEATSKPIDFPDDPSYVRYKNAGGKLARKDWRRDNINQLVQKIYLDVHKIKPWVKVSYGPFGIWKPGEPQGVKGMSQYDEIYADAKLWLNNGWCDFMSPQLYWPIEGDQPFPALLEWWVNESTSKRWVWPGIGVGRHDTAELLRQIAIIRKNPGSRGMVFWSIGALRRHKDKFGDALMQGPFRTNSLVPPMPWLDSKPPPTPRASGQRQENGAVMVTLSRAPGEPPIVFAIWARYGAQWRFLTVPAGSPSLTLNPDPTAGAATAVVITAVDRCGNESERLDVQIK